MITNYQILADSSCDLPFSLARSLGVSYAPLRVQFQGAEYENFLDGDPRSRLDIKAFYSALRTGTPTSTTAVNPEGWSALMAPVLEAGQDILVLAFSSGLSSTYAAAVLAAQELGSRYPARTIRVVDTLCASMGQGLLIYHAVQRQRAGESLEQVTDFVEANKLHLCHWFTVDDLHFLKRGGRISSATAVLGTMLLGWGISLVWEAPFCIAQGMVTVPYLYIGFLAKKKRLFEKKFRPLAILGLLAAALGVALGVLLTGKTDCVSLGEWTMGPVSILLDGIVGLGFIVLFMKVQRLLDNPVTHLIEAVGRRSLYIFCIHTVELTAVPWYLMVQKYAAAPTKGLWLQYAVSLGSIFLLCEILLRRRDVMLKFFPARRRHFAEHKRYVAKH